MQRRQFIAGLGGFLGRRRFLATVGGAAAACPLGALAQQPARLRTIGFLGSGTSLSMSQWTGAFAQRLRELGWVEARTVTIATRWAEGRRERYAEIAAELVRLKVDVIVTTGTAVLAAKQATSTIPIVFAMAQDPLGSGYVASLARPGGNVTGMSAQQADTAGKRVELLHEVVPNLRRLAIMANVGDPGVVLEMNEVQTAARKRGLDVLAAEIVRAEDIVAAFEAFKGRAEALYVVAESLANTNRVRVITLEHGARMPTMHGVRDDVDAGGLMSFRPNLPDVWRRAADLVDKILRGAKPTEIPVEQPTKFELVVNLTTAKAIGLAIPETFLVRADEVIE